MIKNAWIKSIFYTLIVLLGIFFIGACSSEQPAPTEPPLEAVSLQLQWVTQAQFAGYYVALDKGWYAAEGIDLTIEPGAPDLIPVDLVTAGASEFATTLLPDLTVAIEQGKPLISIGQIQQANGLLLIAKKESGIETPQDFTDKRVGVWLGSWDAQFNALMSKEDILPEDFELVSQGFSMEPFLADDLDVASAMIYNEYHAVLESGLSPEEITVIDYADYGLDVPGDVLFTTQALTKNRPDLCEAMLRATLRGWQYAVKNPVEAAEIVLKYDESKIQTREHQLSMMLEIAKLVQVEDHPLGRANEEDVQRTIDTLFNNNILTSPLDPNIVYTNAFWEAVYPSLEKQ